MCKWSFLVLLQRLYLYYIYLHFKHTHCHFFLRLACHFHFSLLFMFCFLLLFLNFTKNRQNRIILLAKMKNTGGSGTFQSIYDKNKNKHKFLEKCLIFLRSFLSYRKIRAHIWFLSVYACTEEREKLNMQINRLKVKNQKQSFHFVSRGNQKVVF